ncbi:MAG TPA: restriction endonuclease subunit R [Spirochaetes bacterium]|nr:restriction endonuclease subunit R [Spirochaetota bacterium]
MNENLLHLVEDFKKDKRLDKLDEVATKQVVIMRIVSCLGWDQYNIDEVHPEYSVSGKRVDYALRYHDENKVFIEVKKVNGDLEKHQEQLLNYSFRQGVKLAILTNGIVWWFYLPLREGSWEQRKAYVIEIYDQESEGITDKFEKLLSKENVISNKAVENAEDLYQSRQRKRTIKTILPKAWQKIITEPDEILVDLIAETTERLCGYKPDNKTVAQFLEQIDDKMYNMPSGETPDTHPIDPPHSPIIPSIINHASCTGKSIISFTFIGNRYPVRLWHNMLIEVCNLMLSAHRNQFDEVLKLVGRKRPYFTRNPNECRSPEKIDNTDIYVETNLSANYIIKISKDILAIFGYRSGDLVIETQIKKGQL